MRIKYLLPLLILLSTCYGGNCTYPQFVLGDQYMSPYAGGEDLLTVQCALMRAEEETLCLASQCGILGKVERLVALGAFWLPVNFFTNTLQHHLFGHGYRVRSLPNSVAKVKSYSFHPPRPYGDSDATTRFTFGPALSPHELVSITHAGFDATTILAGRARLHYLSECTLPAQESVLYLLSQQELPFYLLTLLSGERFDGEKGNDYERYQAFLHLAYPNSYLTKDDLLKDSLINLIDPLTYVALYSWFKYVWTGQSACIPMIPLGSMRALFSTHLSLTPFGPAYSLDLYLVGARAPWLFSISAGEWDSNKYGTIGLEKQDLFCCDGHTFGLRLNVWRQPKLETIGAWRRSFADYVAKNFNEGAKTSASSSERFGGSGWLLYNYSLPNLPFGIHCEVGYKSRGFIPGEPLKATLLLRGGLSLVF